MFPVPPYLHTRNNQILEVTKALASSTLRARVNKATNGYEQRLSSEHQCVNYAQRYPLECISSPLMCTDYLHAYLIPLEVLCSQTMRQPKLFFVCIYYCH